MGLSQRMDQRSPNGGQKAARNETGTWSSIDRIRDAAGRICRRRAGA